MRGRTTALTITLTPDERAELERWQRSTTIPAGFQRRGQIILLRAAGLPLTRIAAKVGVNRRHVSKWLQRFRAQGLPGLKDTQGRSRHHAAVA